MSKHLGNVVDPWSVLDVQGADAVRWYFYTASMPWLPSRFGSENVSESQRKFMGTYWNTYAFYVLYAEIDQFDPSQHQLREENLSVMDRWVLSRLHSTVRFVDQSLETLHITEAARCIQDFVDELSNWYVRRGRERYWGKEMTPDKEAAYMTLFTVLETLGRAAAPFVPFMTESIYQNIVRPVSPGAPESIHLCGFPDAEEGRIDQALEDNMGEVLDLVVLGRAARSSSGLKNRQPLACLYATGAELEAQYAAIIAEELNVKEVVFTDDASPFTTYAVKPQLRTMGPKYGKLLGSINEYLKTVDGNEVMAKFNAGEAYTFTVNGQEVSMTAEDALTELTQKEGFVAQSDRGLTVVLDGNLTPELIDEGFVREIISKLQNMRKEADFDVTDHILVGYEGNERIAKLMESFAGEIKEDVLADDMSGRLSGFEKTWNINGETVKLSVARV